MKATFLVLLSMLAVIGIATESWSSVIGLEGDTMTWEGKPAPPFGTVGSIPVINNEHNVLVILIDFIGQGPIGSTEADWAETLRRVRDYYMEVSYGSLDMTPLTKALVPTTETLAVST